MVKVAAVEVLRHDGRPKQPRVYYSHTDETVWDNLANRRCRPVTIYRKHLPEVLKFLGLPADTKYRWSQYAGCSCGCSPAFILQTGSYNRDDIYVRIEGDKQ